VAISVADAQRSNSYSISAAERTVYVRLAHVRGEDGERIHAFVRRMFAAADSQGAQRLVIDLRSIRGGDAPLLVPLIQGVTTRDRFMRPGAVTLIAGANSFSPTQNAVTLLQRYANPVVVSGSPEFASAR
jgi:hypothetical protein